MAFDVDGDGWIDQVSGGTWFRNPGNPREADRWERFETGATPTHDNLVADIDKDGKLDLVSILDRAGVFWYGIPADPKQRWIEHQVLGVTQPQYHGGIAVGDIDGDGDVDIARVDRWLENADGKGEKWIEHRVFDFGTEGPWGIQTRARLVDLDRDGDFDLIQAEGDVLDGRVAWFENLRGDGREWVRHIIKVPGHKQDSHSICGAERSNASDAIWPRGRGRTKKVSSFKRGDQRAGIHRRSPSMTGRRVASRVHGPQRTGRSIGVVVI
ncbi:MAG TPA: VCBS repeat-containing protein [Planctomycetaceae bacterium]